MLSKREGNWENGMQKEAKRRALKWYWAWLIQIGAMLLLGCVTALSLPLGRVAYGLCLWGVMPLAGLFSACRATRAGLWNYAAWLAPPTMLLLGNVLIWGYPAEPAPVFLCGFISLVGAAAGEVLRRREQNTRKR